VEQEGNVDAEGSNQRALIEDGIYSRLHTMVTAFGELTRSCLLGLQAESLLKTLSRFYRILGSLTRFVREVCVSARG